MKIMPRRASEKPALIGLAIAAIFAVLFLAAPPAAWAHVLSRKAFYARLIIYLKQSVVIGGVVGSVAGAIWWKIAGWKGLNGFLNLLIFNIICICLIYGFFFSLVWEHMPK